jgi:UDP-GlcNAc:undecaprenyl-phosphate/decaprenyl-phosphate GlcNAc-1-phosphate transferase
VMAYALRFEANITSDIEALIFQSLPWIITVKLICFFSFGLYRGLWRYISLPDLTNILKAVLTGSVFSALVVLYLWRFDGYSRAVFIIDGTLLFLAVSGARLVEPMLNEWIHASVQYPNPVIIVGAGDTGELLLQQLKLDRAGTRRVVGFLDDDPRKRGDRIHGLPILGARGDLGRVVQTYEVREILIAIRRPPEDLVRQIQGYCEENGLLWRTVPSLSLNEPIPHPKR